MLRRVALKEWCKQQEIMVRWQGTLMESNDGELLECRTHNLLNPVTEGLVRDLTAQGTRSSKYVSKYIETVMQYVPRSLK